VPNHFRAIEIASRGTDARFVIAVAESLNVAALELRDLE
jgi:hypothetical protein